MLAFKRHVEAGLKNGFAGKVMDRINLCKPGLLGKPPSKK
jgi:hypothetical protein